MRRQLAARHAQGTDRSGRLLGTRCPGPRDRWAVHGFNVGRMCAHRRPVVMATLRTCFSSNARYTVDARNARRCAEPAVNPSARRRSEAPYRIPLPRPRRNCCRTTRASATECERFHCAEKLRRSLTVMLRKLPNMADYATIIQSQTNPCRISQPLSHSENSSFRRKRRRPMCRTPSSAVNCDALDHAYTRLGLTWIRPK